MIEKRERPCPSCRAAHDPDEDRAVLSRDGWSVAGCRVCGFVYMPQFAPAEAFVDDLAWEKQFEREKTERRKRVPVLQWLEDATRWRHRLIPRARPENLIRARVDGGRVLDIGCGTGSHALPFAGDFVPFGIELSRALAQEAANSFAPHGGHCVHAESREGLATFSKDFFDAAVLRSYLEHEAYPNEVLAELSRVLRPGGIAIIKVPNYGSLNRMVMGSNWCGFRIPDHVNYFTKKSLTQIAARHGFSVELPLLWSLPTDDNMWAILRGGK